MITQPAVIQKRLGDVIPSLKVDKDISEILQEKGVPVDSICEFPHARQALAAAPD